jgi:hypothetical protein
VNELRGTGRTTRQLLALPLRSGYVVCHRQQKAYVLHLADHLGRADVRVFCVDDLHKEAMRGLEFSVLELDHDCHMGDDDWHRYEMVRLTRCRLPVEPYVPPQPASAYWNGFIDDAGGGP